MICLHSSSATYIHEVTVHVGNGTSAATQITSENIGLDLLQCMPKELRQTSHTVLSPFASYTEICIYFLAYQNTYVS